MLFVLAVRATFFHPDVERTHSDAFFEWLCWAMNEGFFRALTAFCLTKEESCRAAMNPEQTYFAGYHGSMDEVSGVQFSCRHPQVIQGSALMNIKGLSDFPG